MVKFDKFIERFQKIEAFIQKKAQEIIFKYEQMVIEMHNQQLLKGMNVNDQIMQRGYSVQYGKRRRKQGLQTGFVDLKFTGKYQDSKKLIKKQLGIDIRSAADYEAHLRANFPNHVGLNKQSAETLSAMMSEDLAIEINKYFAK